MFWHNETIEFQIGRIIELSDVFFLLLLLFFFLLPLFLCGVGETRQLLCIDLIPAAILILEE